MDLFNLLPKKNILISKDRTIQCGATFIPQVVLKVVQPSKRLTHNQVTLFILLYTSMILCTSIMQAKHLMAVFIARDVP